MREQEIPRQQFSPHATQNTGLYAATWKGPAQFDGPALSKLLVTEFSYPFFELPHATPPGPMACSWYRTTLYHWRRLEL